MASITLTKVKNPSNDPWLRAVSMDYDVPKDARVFSGWDSEGSGERIAVWVGGDGRGFGAIDADPEGYVKFSEAMWKADLDAAKVASEMHPGVDECEFEPGTFDPGGATIELRLRQSFF